MVAHAIGVAIAASSAIGCRGGTLAAPTDAGVDGPAADVVGDRVASPIDGPPIILVDGGSNWSIDGPVIVVGSGAEAIVTSAACDVWSRATPADGTQDGGGVAGWSRHFASGASMSVSVDGEGRIALLSAHTQDVDFGSGAVPAPTTEWCAFLSSFTAGGAHRWSRGLAAYNARVSSWADGGIAVLLDAAVAGFDAEGAVRWARQLDTAGLSITAQRDGSLFLVTEWTQVVPQPAAAQTVTRLSPTGDLLSAFTFNDDDRASFVSISAAGDIFVVHNVDGAARTCSVTKLDVAGNRLWSETFQSLGFVECLAAAPTEQGGVVLTGWSSGDADFGGGSVMPGAGAVSFATTLDGQGRHLASRAFGDAGYMTHSSAKPTGEVVLAGDFGGSRTLDGITVHTEAAGDTDFLVVELTAALRVARVSHFGNGGGTQSLVDLALAPDGASLLAGSFEGKLDVGWGVMTTTGLRDAFLARITEDSPAPGAPFASDAEPSLPATLAAPAAPQISCDPAATGTSCDLPGSGCPASVGVDAGTSIPEPSWLFYYENPRCIAGRCAWDQRYFQCQGGKACMSGACAYFRP